MKKFKFKLDKYLTYKRFQEKIRMAELAKTLEPMNHYQENINQLLTYRNQFLLTSAERNKEGKLSVQESRFYDHYFTKSKQAQEVFLAAAKKMEPKVAEEREKLKVAHNEVRVLELVRDKQHDNYLIEEGRADEQEMNEMNMRRYQRNQNIQSKKKKK